ncbi:MAG: hypothetical protein ACRC54_01520 [Fusobacteriaceae bacterium]
MEGDKVKNYYENLSETHRECLKRILYLEKKKMALGASSEEKIISEIKEIIEAMIK